MPSAMWKSFALMAQFRLQHRHLCQESRQHLCHSQTIQNDDQPKGGVISSCELYTIVEFCPKVFALCRHRVQTV